LPLPAAVALAWQSYNNKEVVLGLRPEAIHDGEERPVPQGKETEVVWDMELRFVERLGPSQLATLRRGPWTVVARLDARLALAGRTALRVGLDLAQAHLFDAATGRALCHRLPAG
jgi:multiple sugar transport system ATP-binding protein